MCQFQDRAGECVWRLLGKVVTRVEHLVVHAGPGEVTCRRAAVSGREVAICQAVQGDSRDCDGRLRSELLLDLVVGRVAGCESEAMTVGVQHDVDIVGIVEGHRGTFQRGVIEVPVRRVARPDHFGDFAPVGGETGSATLGQEVVEVPEAGFQVRPDRRHGAADVLDEVAVDGDDAGTTVWPQRGGDAGRAPAPVIAGQDGARDVEGIQQRDLAVAWAGFEVGDLQRIGANLTQGFQPWQSSGHRGNWVLDAHRCLPASSHGQCRRHRTTKPAAAESVGDGVNGDCQSRAALLWIERICRDAAEDAGLPEFGLVAVLEVAAGGAL